MASIVILVNLTSVQNYIARKASNVLAKKLHTKVSIAHVRIDFLNHFLLQGLYIGDQANDTILYAGEVQVRITDWFIFEDKPALHYLGLKNSYVHIYRGAASPKWNYDFLAEAFSTKDDKKDTSTGKPFEFDLKKVELDNVRFHMIDKWGGEDEEYDIGSLVVDSKGLDFKKKLLEVSSIVGKNCFITIRDYEAGKPKHLRRHGPLPFDATPFNPDNWAFNVKTISLDNCEFHLVMNDEKPIPGEFDYDHIDVTKINAYVTAATIRGDTIRGNVENFQVKERSGLVIKTMQSKVTVSPVASICENLYLETNNSKLHNYYAMRYKHFPNFTNYLDSVIMEGNLDNSTVDMKDIAFFAPELKAFPPIIFKVSGDGKGSVADLRAHHLNITDGNTVLKGSLAMKGLPDIYKTLITFSDGEIFTTNAGIVRYAPALRNNPNIDINKLVYAYFKGSYEGYVENFGVNGIFNTNLGSITTNVKLNIPGFNSNSAVYSGIVSASQAQIGPFLKQPLLGSITFKENISGRSFDPEHAELNIDGTVNEFSVNDYAYHNIITHGTLTKQQFNGTLIVDDPNLALQFDGGVNYRDKILKLNATAHLGNSNFRALHLFNDSLTASGNFDLNCTGNNIDNFYGYASLTNIDLKRNNHRVDIESVLINSTGSADNKLLTLTSNDIVASIKGNYQLSKLPASIQYYLSRYIPNYIGIPEKSAPEQNFEFQISTLQIDSILAATFPIIRGFDSSLISGSLNTIAQKVTLNAKVPNGSIGKFHMNDLVINGQGNLDAISLNTTIGNAIIGDSIINGSIGLTAALSNDSVSFTIATTTPDPASTITLNGQIIARKDSLFLTVLPSQFLLNQVKWDIAGGSKIVYSDKYLSVQDFSLTSGLQKISAATELQNKQKALIVSTENLDLGQFGSWAGLAAYQPDGRVNGTIKIDKIFQELYVSANLKATGVMLGTDTVGTVNFIGDYDGAKKLYSLDPQTGIFRDNASVTASGNISFDSATHQKLDGIIQFNNAAVAWTSPFLTGIFSHLAGTLNGSINFGGAAYDPIIKGSVALNNAGFHVDYTGCSYTIPIANIKIDNKTISYGSVQVLDRFNNTATLTGRFTHNMFKDMRMRLSVRSKKMEVLNLTTTENNYFYGNIIAGMDSFNIRGPFNNVRLNIYNAVPAAKSQMYIPVTSGGDVGTYSYVSFKKYGKNQDKFVRKDKFKIHINIDANLNTLAEMHIVLDPTAGDEIMAHGDGRLQLDIPPDNDMHITGLYTIESGMYTFTLKKLFIRQFKLNPASVISFNGPFGETNMHVDATYPTKARLYDLLSDGDKTVIQGSTDLTDAQTPQWVNVILHMNGSLKNPVLTFDLDLEDKHSQNTYAYRKLMLINTDDRQKTQQVGSLLLISSFLPPDGGSGSVLKTGTNNNINQILSNSASTGLTNILNKITGDKQLNVAVRYANYNYSDQAIATNRTQATVNINKNFFNDRLTVAAGGSSDWGKASSSSTNASSFNITGDFRIQYLLSYTSGLRLNCFRTSDYDITLDKDIIRSGVGISWRKSFDGFGDFFKSNKAIMKEKDEAEKKILETADTTDKRTSGIQ